MWSGVPADVARLMSDVCQEPYLKEFQQVAFDSVGPIIPITERMIRSILTLVDYLQGIRKLLPYPFVRKRVLDTLVEIFSRIGVHKEVLSARGTQFTSGSRNQFTDCFHLNS